MSAAPDAPAPLRIDYSVSREQYIEGLRETTQVLLRSVQWGTAFYALTVLSVVCGIAIGMGYVELINGYIGRNWRLQWLIVVAFLGVCLLTIWQQRLRAARVHATCAADENLMLGTQSMTASADGLLHEGRLSVTRVAWPAVKRVLWNEYKLLIILNNYSFMVVPMTDTAQRAAWLEVLRAQASAAVVARLGGDAQGSKAGRADSALSAPTPAPIAPSAFGLRENLRAGLALAVFRRVPLQRFVATPEAFALLVVLELALFLAQGISGAGFDGYLNIQALPRALLVVPLVLLFGLIAARVAANDAVTMALPVALMAAGLVVSVVGAVLGIAIQEKILVIASRHWKWLFYFQIAWWSLIIAIAAWRHAAIGRPAGAGMAMLGVTLLAAPAVWVPPERLWMPAQNAAAQRAEFERYHALADEQGFYAQHAALQRALSALQPERAGTVDVYALTAGLYASEDVFMKEVRLIDALMRTRFDAGGRSLVLMNNPGTVREFPIASATSLNAALRHMGGLMNRDEDVLVLYLSSHGSEQHDLSVNFWPLRLKPINPASLKQALDASGIRWKVVVVSACYSGGFIEPLKDDDTLIITASSATRTSFGCGNQSDATYLAKALYDEALRKTYSFEAAFATAREAIREREKAQGFEPSDPQIHVGEAIRAKLGQVEARLNRPAPAPAQ